MLRFELRPVPEFQATSFCAFVIEETGPIVGDAWLWPVVGIINFSFIPVSLVQGEIIQGESIIFRTHGSRCFLYEILLY